MRKMSNRIRNHVLEDKSLAHLTLSISPWVVHSYDKNDYGIDVQIELFSNQGDRTGIRFYGQLKATDLDVSEDLLRLDRSHFEYWSNHTDPVILFRYFDKTKEFKWCWLHEAEWRLKPDHKTLDVAPFLKEFNPEISLSEIEEYLCKRREILFLKPSIPYQITLECIPKNFPKASAIVADLSAVLESKNIKIFLSSMGIGHFKIILEEKAIVCMYGGQPGIVFHYEGFLENSEIIDMTLWILFMSACRDKETIFLKILCTSRPVLILFEFAQTIQQLPFLVDGMVLTFGLESTIELLYPLLMEKSDSVLWMIFYMSCAEASWCYKETSVWIKYLRIWMENSPIEVTKGSIAYNLGNALTMSSDYKDACDAYSSALFCSPSYNDKSYFWVEFGTAHFELDNYIEAVSCYQKALDLEDSPQTRWFLADSLFYCGEYQKALEHLNIAIPQLTDIKLDYPLLLSTMCEELVTFWELTSQQLEEIDSTDIEKLQYIGTDNLIETLRPFIQKNALDGFFNYNAGILAINAGDCSMAMYRFIACALVQHNDSEAWMNAFKCAFNINEYAYAIVIAKQAHFCLKESFLPALFNLLSDFDNLTIEKKETFESFIIEMIKEFESIEESNKIAPVIRFPANEYTGTI
jgi:tetratricopeptide (TPR) repeat protein